MAEDKKQNQPAQQKQQKQGQQPFQQKQQQKPMQQPAAPKVDYGPDFKHIVRIGNKDIKGERKALVGLTEINGISYSVANAICNLTNTDKFKRIGTLDDKQIEDIDKLVNNIGKQFPSWMFNRKKDRETGQDTHLITVDLKLATENDIKFMKMIKSYKGVRHSIGQPVRGQRTKNRSRKQRQAKAKNQKMRRKGAAAEAKATGTPQGTKGTGKPIK